MSNKCIYFSQFGGILLNTIFKQDTKAKNLGGFFSDKH